MKKKSFFKICFIFLIFIQGCGFEPIYSSKNFMFKINKIDYESNSINNQIAGSLRSLSNENAKNSLNLVLNSKKEKRIVSKNSKGDTELYELKITLKMIVETKTKKIMRNFENNIKYSNNDNKFELKQYESEIEKQIISDLIEQIIIFFYEI